MAFKTMNYEAMIIFILSFLAASLYIKRRINTLLMRLYRVAIANTSGVFQNLGFMPKAIMRIKTG